MSDTRAIERTKRFRKLRRERGDREMNVWVSTAVAAALDEAVLAGQFKTRQDAIHAALAAAFVRKEVNLTS
ncbi:hypothetical protein DC522_20780 [Microvirga sp. KLBC 81]|nr:hypothetical protein DC522_20780 [Microvirga sp. KLBC 81]